MEPGGEFARAEANIYGYGTEFTQNTSSKTLWRNRMRFAVSVLFESRQLMNVTPDEWRT